MFKNRPQDPKETEKSLTSTTENIKAVKDWLMTLLTCIVGLTLIAGFVIAPFRVSGESMYPTLKDGQLMLMTKFNTHHLKQGDIVIIQKDGFPSGQEAPIVKRVIATAGMHIRVDYDENMVYIDDEPYPEPYINCEDEDVMIEMAGMTFNECIVPEGYVFVMGDNRNHSADSRYQTLGPVSLDEVIGKALAF